VPAVIRIGKVGTAIGAIKRYGDGNDRRALTVALNKLGREATVNLAIAVLERAGKTDRRAYWALTAALAGRVVKPPRVPCAGMPSAAIIPFPEEAKQMT
jgi:hypothetical protein